MAGFAVVAVFLLAALAVLGLFVRREPAPAVTAEPRHPDQRLPSMAEVFRLPRVRIGLVALVAGQVVMITIMTMTPVHLTEAGHGLGVIGLVLSGHTLGMFAFSPISGRLADRAGPLPIILAGFSLLAVASLLAASAPVEGGIVLVGALFLLGLGWNLNFVAGSALLTRGVPSGVRIRAQGATDALIWTSGAAASALAGVVLELTDYGVLSLAGAALVVIPVVLILIDRDALVPAEA